MCAELLLLIGRLILSKFREKKNKEPLTGCCFYVLRVYRYIIDIQFDLWLF
jgi:hypothetical protein